MKLNKFFATVISLLVFITSANAQPYAEVTVLQEQYQVPLLKGKSSNPFIRLKLVVSGNKAMAVSGFQFSLKGTTSFQDIEELTLYYFKNDSTASASLDFSKAQVFGSVSSINNKVTINGTQLLNQGIHYFWLSCTLAQNANALNEADASCTQISIGDKRLVPAPEGKNIHQKFATYQ
jgi:hypothetical protein